MKKFSCPLKVRKLIKSTFFPTPWQTILSLCCIAFLWMIIPPVLQWFIFDASFIGSSRESCHKGGACWVSVFQRIPYYLYGDYPESERWRIHFLVVTILAWAIATYRQAISRSTAMGLGFLLLPLAWGLLYEIPHILTQVETAKWGGLFLTLVIATFGIIASLPLGIALALGRRSQLPIIKALSIAFIELWRGVPLITVLFMASFMFPLFLPEWLNVDKLWRCLLGVTFFSSAYMAEVVRGGLQSLAPGQEEAAKSLGLGYWQIMGFIILPQALKKVIPGIVNTFIGLFKDTTLVSTVAMFDLLGTIQNSTNDPYWLGYSTEGYIFAGLLFWVFCYSMSQYSRNLELRLGTELRG